MNQILTGINDFMYTYILLILLVGAGVFFTVFTKGVQVRLLKDGLKSIMEKKTGNEGEKSVSSFQALMISTASRVGTGNIAGIATAIAAGGPGAVFWMWVMAVIGSSSAFIESTLAQIYKVEENGQFRGGPSYYMEKALKKRWLGILFSIALIICFAYGFNGLQSFNMSSALEYYIPNYSQTHVPMIVGIILAVAFAAVIWGGAHRIGVITSFIVPVMAVVYILIGIYTMLTNISSIPHVFGMIFENAFSARSFAGGFAGSAVMIGIKRGLFSNEAGMGSAPNAAASADVDHPVKQGLVQVISVFIDTLLICSTTAMMLLISGVQGESGVLDGGNDGGDFYGSSRPAHHHVHRHSHCRLDGGRRHSHHGLLRPADHFSPVLSGDGAAALLFGFPGHRQFPFHHWNRRSCAVRHWLRLGNSAGDYGGSHCLRRLLWG